VYKNKAVTALVIMPILANLPPRRHHIDDGYSLFASTLIQIDTDLTATLLLQLMPACWRRKALVPGGLNID
jgi:hypothetical protein